MIAIVDSLTGQGERFASKLGIPYVNIRDYNGEGESLLLLTRSFNFGEVTQEAIQFMDIYNRKVRGVAVSGNRNWGTNFGAAGDKISKEYQIDLVHKYEGSGFTKDVEIVQDWIRQQEGSI